MPLWISLKVAAIATLITVILATPVAYSMARRQTQGRHRRGQSIVDSLLLLPLVLPPTVIGFGLLWLLGDRSPLAILPLNIVFTWWAAVLTAVVVAFPLMYRSSRAAFEQIDAPLLGVARTLGATKWQVFHRIAMPLAGPGIMAGTLLSFARALGEFGATLMLAGNIPGKTQTLPMAVYFAVEGGDLRTATQWSVVTGAIALITVLLSNRLGRPPHKKQSKTRTAPTQPIHRQPIESPLESAPTATKQPLTLSVDITKTLPSFTLSIQFETQDALIGILGASGAGKSLLLRCLAGIETPDSGRIVLGDRILYDSESAINLPSRERTIALLFQNYALFPHLTVSENIAFGMRQQSKQEKDQRIWQELTAVHMERFAHSYPHQLSGGQQQRVALARAIASQPQLLLLDEPFSALDSHLRSQLAGQLFDRIEHYQGTTLVVTHSFTEAYQAEQMIVLDQGQAVKQATPREVFERPGKGAIAQLTGPINQSPIQILNPNNLHATHWNINLQLPENALSKNALPENALPENALPENALSEPPSPSIHSNHFSVGIRPHCVSFVTKNMYSSTQPPPQRAAKITSSSFDKIEPALSANINQAPSWLANISYLPHSVVLSLKLHSAANHPHDYHLQAIVTPQIWQQIKAQPLPWTVYLPPEHLIVLRP